MDVKRVLVTKAAEGFRFLTRSELFTDEETQALENNGKPLIGQQH